MKFDRQSDTNHLLYAQLLSQCLRGAAPTGRGISFVKKTIKGKVHWYLQATVGEQKKQHYLGPDSDEIKNMIDQETRLWEEAKDDVNERRKLVSMLTAGGAYSLSGTEARIFEVLERAGLFLADGVVVGSYAFLAYGNMLGVRWESELIHTQDIDIAKDYRIQVAIENKKTDLKAALKDSQLGIFELPAFNAKDPSTSFMLRGRQLSVSLLTPLIGKPSSKPIHLKSINAAAEPVRFLDYLLEDTQKAVLVANAGILVNVPSPARFAIHKLVVSQRRQSILHTKVRKDISQAEAVLSVLVEDRPGDIIVAMEAADKMPEKFRIQFEAGKKKLSATTANALNEILL